MAKRKKRKFDTEGLVEQMFAWIPEGPVGVQLALRGVIRSIELRGIPTSRLAPVPVSQTYGNILVTDTIDHGVAYKWPDD